MTEESANRCGAHEGLIGTIASGFRRMDDGFTTMNKRMDELFRDLGAREESAKGQGREIGDLKRKMESVPVHLAEALDLHSSRCVIGDIAEVGIKTDRRERHRDRQDSFETPPRGSRRQSFSPPGSVFKIPVPKVVIWLAVAVGVAVAAGGWAWGFIRDNAKSVVPDRLLAAPADPPPPDSPRSTTSASSNLSPALRSAADVFGE